FGVGETHIIGTALTVIEIIVSVAVGAGLSAGRGEDAQPIEGNVKLGRHAALTGLTRRQAVINRASGATTGSSLWRIAMPHFDKASAAETVSVATVGLNGTLIPSARWRVTIM